MSAQVLFLLIFLSFFFQPNGKKYYVLSVALVQAQLSPQQISTYQLSSYLSTHQIGSYRACYLSCFSLLTVAAYLQAALRPTSTPALS